MSAVDDMIAPGHWLELRVTPELRLMLGNVPVRAFQRTLADGHLSVFVAREPHGWHLSISHRRNLVLPGGGSPPGRLPTWEEIRDARYRFVPDDVTMAMLLPPSGEYVNQMETCMHLWQVPNDTGEKP